MYKREKLICLAIILFGLIVLVNLPVLAVGIRGTVPEIEIAKLETAPIIDGKLTDEAWIEISRSFRGVLTGWKSLDGSRLIQNQRIVYLGYDDDALYISMICYVDDIESLSFGKDVWTDDTLEIHLENQHGEYFQLGISCMGDWAIGTLDNKFSFNSATNIGKNYWSVEVAIPWKEIRVEPKLGTEIGFNVAGHDYYNGWVTWGPSYGNFRLTENFCYLKLQ